ncbi:hypothetical protein BH10PLA1_BH10PLA1_21580 [soil metagenome]
MQLKFTMPSKPTRTFVAVGLWIAAIGLSFLADGWVATAARAHGVPDFLKSTGLAAVLKIPGEYWFTAVLAIVAMIYYPRRPRWHAGAFVLLCGLLSGVNGLIKWIAGRARPFKILGTKQESTFVQPFNFQPLYDGLGGLFGTPNLCFPSGHAALAFANAAAIAILFPRWRWIAYAVATVTAAERFLETAHYFSDTVAAAALGIGGAHLLAWLLAAKSDDLSPPSPGTPSEGR